MQEVKKVVAIGPESTGKSTLCKELAKHFGTVWCPEYAREYLLKNGINYNYEDLLNIAKGQCELENNYRTKAIDEWKANPKTSLPLLFVDTDMYVMKVWCEYVFGKVHPFIVDKIAENKCDFYLLCNVNLPWVKDELREYPDLQAREGLFAMYKEILTNQSVPFTTISGNYKERLSTAIATVDKLLT